ncbi:amidohydrolase family protein [Aliiroseovarius sp. F20344]|uniref:amidohydrolase family protein n=1 Tax=Aliiroseovarius sp. F20344 TaxID=2926414 RepID=UPI001FF1E614|nr:amidohydrolase family protein [Aliiroseovarius sp. F20344]MCK0141053.1 amidohydrolase family protein [Aliiroseovarius sp. F20344]
MIDAHHHLWDLKAVHYPWLMAKGVRRFFGDPAPIQRDYLLDEFRADAAPHGFTGSVHIQVGAEDGLEEARWVQSVADANPDWPLKQVVFCDLTAPDLNKQLDAFQSLSTVVGVRQIVGRAPEEDATTGTNDLLNNPKLVEGLREAGARGLSFDLQLIPELMRKTAQVLERAPDTKVALCHAGSPHDRSAERLANWGVKLEHLSALPQVFCKLSGLGMFDHNWTNESIRPIVETCLNQFGPERSMFGSNFPVDKLYSDYGSVADSYRRLVSPSNHDTVFRNTARHFYLFTET